MPCRAGIKKLAMDAMNRMMNNTADKTVRMLLSHFFSNPISTSPQANNVIGNGYSMIRYLDRVPGEIQ